MEEKKRKVSYPDAFEILGSYDPRFVGLTFITDGVDEGLCFDIPVDHLVLLVSSLLATAQGGLDKVSPEERLHMAEKNRNKQSVKIPQARKIVISDNRQSLSVDLGYGTIDFTIAPGAEIVIRPHESVQ